MMKRRQILAVSVVLLICACLLAMNFFGPCISVSVDRHLVGPDEESIDLLGKHASLAEIRAAVKRSGKPVDKIAWLGATLMCEAVKEGRVDVAGWLLEQGASPNGPYHDIGGVPLEEAIRLGNLEMVELLIQAGADPDIEMKYNVTPRLRAEELRNSAILAALPPKRTHATSSGPTPAGSVPTTLPK